MTTFPPKLEYCAGSDTSPGDPFGRFEMLIEADGRISLVHHGRTWTATVDRAALEMVWAALERGGFPTIPQHRIPGGSALRTLTAHRGETTSGGHIAYNAADKLPGYSEAFPILDSIVRQIVPDAIDAGTNHPAAVVRDIVAVGGVAGP